MVPPDRLRALDRPAFAVLVERLVSALAAGDVSVSPPSPAGDVEAVADGHLYRALHRPGNPVSARAVREASETARREGFDGAWVITTGTFTDEAREAGDRDGLRLVDGDALVALAADHGIDLPLASDPPLEERVRDLAAYWPDDLADLAVRVVTAIDGLAAFDYRVNRGDRSAELDAVYGDSVAVKVRFSERSLLVFVPGERDFRRVIAVSALGDYRPDPDRVVDDVRRAVERILDDAER